MTMHPGDRDILSPGVILRNVMDLKNTIKQFVA